MKWHFGNMGSIAINNHDIAFEFFETLKFWKFETKKPKDFETKRPRKFETKKPRKFETKTRRNQEAFQVRESPPPLNIPTPTPSPAPLLGDTMDLGVHEGNVKSQNLEQPFLMGI